MKPVRKQQAHKHVSKERCGSYWGKWGKDFIPIFVSYTEENCVPVGEIIVENKENGQEHRKNFLRNKTERNGIIYLNYSKDTEGKW